MPEAPTRPTTLQVHPCIRMKGARVHNLKDVHVDIPKHEVVVFTGVSGSGKSSLVFDTIYTEAQRQLIETFSAFARRRLPKLSRPDVDAIENIATSIVIDQKKMGANMRSTVGTATEVATYLRLLYSRVTARWARCQAARASGSRWRANCNATWSICSTSWTSPRSGCTRTTSRD